MGPQSYSCWGLVRADQREIFGRELPIIVHPRTLRAVVETINNSEIRDCWPEVERPSHGDLVTMTSSLQPHHIGTYLAIDGGRVHHCTEREGVMCCSLVQLKLEGFRRLTFHTYRPRA
jgi:hypothetical protein